MSGQRVGYVRVSTSSQNPDRQLAGEKIDRVFSEKASAKGRSNRPKLEELLDYVREGDTVVVHSMDRLARNLKDLLTIVEGLIEKGIKVEFINEKLIFCGNDHPMSQLMLSLLGAIAQFERSLIRERQKEGIELAKQAGKYTGRKKALSKEQVEIIHKRILLGESKSSLAKEFGVTRKTLYGYLKELS